MHVTEENIIIIDVNLLVSECIRANRGDKAFAYVISPFISDFKIPAKLIKFASNVINVNDVETLSDLIGLLLQNGGDVYIVTRPPSSLRKSTISDAFIKKQIRILTELERNSCKIRFNSRLHAKATITSQGAVSGSFNLTESGRFYNIEEGHFFPNVLRDNNNQYLEKLEWAIDLFNNYSKEINDWR